ncbi:MAG: tetratricopeptide repeat protein [Chloroflexi bacterium]|nr:tetratricopeptide repeat protein [Chloroflexota bacterium]MBP7044309.1 tetratricopeptide repeat protein [Chloroflexota bacterium]
MIWKRFRHRCNQTSLFYHPSRLKRGCEFSDVLRIYACYEAIKDNPDYFIEVGELLPLYYQLMSRKKFDLAIGLLEMDLHAFPERLGLYSYLARTHLQNGDRAQAEAVLRRALAIQPDRADVLDMLSSITNV